MPGPAWTVFIPKLLGIPDPTHRDLLAPASLRVKYNPCFPELMFLWGVDYKMGASFFLSYLRTFHHQFKTYSPEKTC